ncbi:hypothetical protein GIB67_042285 [Kingdonia uniflora]|uniref:DUF7356 domain-containing protein n=1 Tax=Kingdonia uniflora TaxID=39325 RepID=A0A7J7LEA0_9MAGN|nr:hypothetical protein GIB67_042285 [Kingdonia uniflora]
MGSPPRNQRYHNGAPQYDDDYGDDFDFASNRHQGRNEGNNIVSYLIHTLQSSNQDMKLNLPDFNGKMDLDNFTDWLNRVEKIFVYKWYESEAQKVSKYINGLTKQIQDEMTMLNVYTVVALLIEKFRDHVADIVQQMWDEDDVEIAIIDPKEDSPDLSLLIKNTGANPLTVDISAPDFVSLEKTTVQLKPKEPNTVKVSISKETSNGTSIILKVKDSQCIIDITTLTSHNLLEKTDLSNKKSSITDIITRTPILYISIAAVLVIASVWTCVRFCRRNQSKDGAKYQKIEMELPIFSEGKGEVDGNNDRWDDGWGDSWDDEEAPKTPSIPVTPSLSSKGLASRKHTKDAWKD